MSIVISMEEFNSAASDCWKRFYGSKSKPILASWYGNYKGTVSDPKFMKSQSLKTCIQTLLRDHDAIQTKDYYIPLPVDEFPLDLEEIKKDLRVASTRNRSAGYELLLLNNQSSLQKVLKPPPLSDTSKNKEVPRSNQWCPSLCVFPFHSFRPHLNLWLKKKNTEGTLANVDEDIIKLRYAEYLSLLMSNTNQFILGLFTVYGPDILEYPIRVLEILKRRGLLRSGTKLFDLIAIEELHAEDNGFEEIFEFDEEDLILTDKAPQDSTNSSAQNLPVTAMAAPSTNGGISKLNGVGSMTPPASTSISKTHANGVKTISSDSFYNAVEPLWKSFYGEGTQRPIPPVWFSNFRSQFLDANKKGDILDTCIQVIRRDQELVLENPAIFHPSLKDMLGKEFNVILKCLKQVEPKHPSIPNNPNAGYEEIMVIGKSFLQKALVEPPSLDASADRAEKAKSIPQPNEWCPSRCVCPFPAFQAHVYRSLCDTAIKNLDLEILKLRYVEFLSIHFGRASQFVRGIATAYGSHLLNYPIRVLQILRQRKLLRPGTKLCEALDGLVFDADPYIDLFKQENRNADSSQLILIPNQVEVAAGQQPPTVIPQMMGDSSPASTKSEDVGGHLTVSEEEFLSSVAELWRKFHGEGNEKQIPKEWYICYKVTFPVNNKDGILTNCIHTLLHDAQALGNSTSYSIPSLFKDYGDVLAKMVNDKQVYLYSGGSYDAYMRLNKSFLQAVLCDPMSSSGQMRKAIPVPVAWCPSQSVFPFPAFMAHVHWYLLNKKKGNGVFPYCDLMEVMKLRYVEYLSVLNPTVPTTQQFLLGLFSAYGPNALEYPIRILQILKRRGLLRPGTPLYEAIDDKIHAGKTYISVFPKSVSTPSPKLEVQANKIGSRELRDGNAKVKVEPPTPSTFAIWKLACEKALKKLSADSSTEFKIPDSYYAELFQSYSQSVQQPLEQNIFNLFILAVWTGTTLNEFQVPTVPSPVACSTKVATEVAASSSTKTGNVESSEFQERLLAVFRSDDAGGGHSGVDAILQKFGIMANPNMEFIRNKFLAGKKLELEALETIQKEFKGEGLRNFVKEFSVRICWVTDEEDLQLSAMLIGGLIERKLISKPFVIHSLKQGVLTHLPELSVKLFNVTQSVALFLYHLFSAEEDLVWFLILTEDLRRDFFPVWLQLLNKTVDVIKKRNSISAVMELFSKTPDSNQLLHAMQMGETS